MTFLFWKNIFKSGLIVRANLAKIEPTLQTEVLRQQIFSNPLVTNFVGRPLGVNGLSEGCTILMLDAQE
jgi:hypothetical protein